MLYLVLLLKTNYYKLIDILILTYNDVLLDVVLEYIYIEEIFQK